MEKDQVRFTRVTFLGEIFERRFLFTLNLTTFEKANITAPKSEVRKSTRANTRVDLGTFFSPERKKLRGPENVLFGPEV